LKEGQNMKSDIGPTGDFPQGALGPDDQGGLNIGIAHDQHGNVHVKFGTEVKWIAMPSDKAISFAKLIMHHAGAKKVEVEL
jgi:hypothetical protein